MREYDTSIESGHYLAEASKMTMSYDSEARKAMGNTTPARTVPAPPAANDKMRVYNQAPTPPDWAMSELRDGRGLTAIKAQWMIEQATAAWGVPGEGWGWYGPRCEICEDTGVVWCGMHVWHGTREQEVYEEAEWPLSKANGKRDMEAVIKCRTRALKKALSRFGFGHAVYQGCDETEDGTPEPKPARDNGNGKPPTRRSPSRNATPPAVSPTRAAANQRLIKWQHELRVTDAAMKAWMREAWGMSSKDMSMAGVEALPTAMAAHFMQLTNAQAAAHVAETERSWAEAPAAETEGASGPGSDAGEEN